MYRVLFCVIAAMLLCVPVGCRSCAHPFDYCAPTYTAAGDCPCDPNLRAGSILVSNASPVPGRLVPEPAPESAPLISPERSNQKPIEESMLPASEVQLIAETTRILREPKQEQEETPILMPKNTPASSSIRDGWTARKSRTTYQ